MFPDAAHKSENHKDKRGQAHDNMGSGLVSTATRAPHSSTTWRPRHEIPSCHLSQELSASRSREGTPLHFSDHDGSWDVPGFLPLGKAQLLCVLDATHGPRMSLA